MAVQFSCSCGKTLRAPETLIGKKIKCPACGAVVRVEGETPAPAEVAEAAEFPPTEPAAAAAVSVAEAEPEVASEKRSAKDEMEEKEDRSAAKEDRGKEAPEEDVPLLQSNAFVVKQQAKLFSSRLAYDLLDGETGEPLGAVRAKSGGLLGLLLGKDRAPVTLEVRSTDGELVFSVRRRGLLFKKIEAVDQHGEVLGRYKAKMFSLTGGFHVYDAKGKHFAEIRGNWCKSEYRFLTPCGIEMGLGSKQSGGLRRSLFTTASTYGVVVNDEYSRDSTAKMLMLGAAIAIDALFAKKKAKKGAAGSDEEGAEEVAKADE